MTKVADNWFDLPRSAQGIKLYQHRDRAAGEEPSRHRGAAAREFHGAAGG